MRIHDGKGALTDGSTVTVPPPDENCIHLARVMSDKDWDATRFLLRDCGTETKETHKRTKSQKRKRELETKWHQVDYFRWFLKAARCEVTLCEEIVIKGDRSNPDAIEQRYPERIARLNANKADYSHPDLPEAILNAALGGKVTPINYDPPEAPKTDLDDLFGPICEEDKEDKREVK